MQLWYQGYCTLTRWELGAGFDRERITNVVWREIQEIWEEGDETEEGAPVLKIIKCDETYKRKILCPFQDFILI